MVNLRNTVPYYKSILQFQILFMVSFVIPLLIIVLTNVEPWNLWQKRWKGPPSVLQITDHNPMVAEAGVRAEVLEEEDGLNQLYVTIVMR